MTKSQPEFKYSALIPNPDAAPIIETLILNEAVQIRAGKISTKPVSLIRRDTPKVNITFHYDMEVRRLHPNKVDCSLRLLMTLPPLPFSYQPSITNVVWFTNGKKSGQSPSNPAGSVNFNWKEGQIIVDFNAFELTTEQYLGGRLNFHIEMGLDGYYTNLEFGDPSNLGGITQPKLRKWLKELSTRIQRGTVPPDPLNHFSYFPDASTATYGTMLGNKHYLSYRTTWLYRFQNAGHATTVLPSTLKSTRIWEMLHYFRDWHFQHNKFKVSDRSSQLQIQTVFAQMTPKEEQAALLTVYKQLHANGIQGNTIDDMVNYAFAHALDALSERVPMTTVLARNGLRPAAAIALGTLLRQGVYHGIAYAYQAMWARGPP